MLEEMDTYEINVLDVFHCPHHKDGVIPELSKECNSRKPKPGMIFRAAEKHHLDLSRSIIIGDNESDLITGKNANLYGCYLVGSDEHSLMDSKNTDGCFENLNDFSLDSLCPPNRGSLLAQKENPTFCKKGFVIGIFRKFIKTAPLSFNLNRQSVKL